VPKPSDLEIPINNKSYEQAQSFKTNVIWNTLDRLVVEGVIEIWLRTLNRLTQIKLLFRDEAISATRPN
jgi:hypothetical protein